MKKHQFWLGIGIALALISIAAVHWYTDVPNNPNPLGTYAISMDTQDHAPGGTPYNWISIDQLSARIGSASTAGFLRTNNDTGYSETFALGTTFTGAGNNVELGAGTHLVGDVQGSTNLQPSFVTVTADPNDPNTRVITAGLNITITDGGPGGQLLIASSTTATITTITNNTFVNTNVFISTSNAYFNIVIQTNVYTITQTNNTFVNTNLFIAITNYSTNLFFISGKGNTLVITNVFIAVPGSLVNSNTANNSAVITDSAHAYTNAANAHGVFTNSASGPPSFGLLQPTELANVGTAGTYTKTTFNAQGLETSGASAVLASADFANQGTTTTVLHGNAAGNPSWTSVANADLANSTITFTDPAGIGMSGSPVALGGTLVLDTAGATPIFNLSSSTNLIYRYTTNAVTALALTFGKAFTTNLSANIVITAINAQDIAAYESGVFYCTNSGGTDRTVTLPGSFGGPGLGVPPVITVTNKQSCRIFFDHYGNQESNAWFIARY